LITNVNKEKNTNNEKNMNKNKNMANHELERQRIAAQVANAVVKNDPER